MNALLEKFDSIDISTDTFLSKEDQQFTDETQAQYQEVVLQLKEWKTAIEKAERELGASKAYTIENYGQSGDRMYVSSNRDLGWAEYLKFSPTYCYKYITQTIESALRARNSRIVEYFNKKYHLTISLDKTEKQLVGLNEVIEFVLSHNEGMSFTEKGEHNLKEEFHKRFGWGKRILKGDTISFESVRLSTHSDTWRALVTAVSFFEQNTVSQLDFVDASFRQLDAPYPNYVNYGIVFDMASACEKVKSFKYYKNHRFDLKFASKSLAAEFYDMFRLGQDKN